MLKHVNETVELFAHAHIFWKQKTICKNTLAFEGPKWVRIMKKMGEGEYLDFVPLTEKHILRKDSYFNAFFRLWNVTNVFLKIYKQYRPHDKTGFVLGELNIFNLCIWLRSKVSYAFMQRFSFCWVRCSFRFSNSDTGSI